jgi:class 3 adenylate cyclase
MDEPDALETIPSGTVTFLFTDVESSTRLWEQHPEAMRPALARHDAILRAATAAHRGLPVKGTGDGLHAAFARPTDGVAAALAAQRALAAEDWGSLDTLRVRMALHTGVAEERDGDYFGPAVNRAARILVPATVAKPSSRRPRRRSCASSCRQTSACARSDRTD